ncbi:NUDIX domain-containing protein [Umezawaea endophytica]|uniref:NUDIX domain-containing protein n=1 Tax=Umezawaea endophytica TaxID=1654476 RepID=A0A9X2VKQ4_9PSEU|nr:NUDIX domain-containing protein [Umezawaea endophytica]MCS7478301.1 NUDIX domain-containing protein [Umezawaea endophytica]
MTSRAPIARRSVRAVLIDDQDRLVLVRRTKPDRPVYWTTAGGGVEPEDVDRRATAAREVLEEVGATAVIGEQVFLTSDPTAEGLRIAHFHLARLLTIDPDARTGAEHGDPTRGGFETDVIALTAVSEIDLRPPELRDFLVANAEALLAEVDLLEP